MRRAFRLGLFLSTYRPLRRVILLSICTLLGRVASGSGMAHAEGVRVYAAASLTTALQVISEQFPDSLATPVRFSFAASSTLARQIEQGAPADIYLSANPAWMDYLQDRDRIEGESRIDLWGNDLVVVAPGDEPVRVVPVRGSDFAGAFQGRLALADPDHVPAGMYARQALVWMGWWRGVQDRLALGQNVRVALAYVERGACPVGVVYATDAAASKKVDVVMRFPDAACDPILYPGAIVKNRGRESVRRVFLFLQSETARREFERQGFRAIFPSGQKGSE